MVAQRPGVPGGVAVVGQQVGRPAARWRGTRAAATAAHWMGASPRQCRAPARRGRPAAHGSARPRCSPPGASARRSVVNRAVAHACRACASTSGANRLPAAQDLLVEAHFLRVRAASGRPPRPRAGACSTTAASSQASTGVVHHPGQVRPGAAEQLGEHAARCGACGRSRAARPRRPGGPARAGTRRRPAAPPGCRRSSASASTARSPSNALANGRLHRRRHDRELLQRSLRSPGRGGAPGRAPRRRTVAGTSSAARREHLGDEERVARGEREERRRRGGGAARQPRDRGPGEPRERERAARTGRRARPARVAGCGRPPRRGTSPRPRRRARRRGGRRSAGRRGSRRRPSGRPRARARSAGTPPSSVSTAASTASRSPSASARGERAAAGPGGVAEGSEGARGQQVVAGALQHASRGEPRPAGTRARGSSCRCPPRRRRARRSPRPAPPGAARLPARRAHRRVRAAQEQPRRPSVRNG